MLKRFLLFMSLLTLTTVVWAQAEEEESNLKAAFIYNFTRYIEWNNDYNDNDFIIGIVGASAIDKAILEIAKNELVKNRRIIVRHYSKPEDIGYCHILFIPQTCTFPIQSVLEKVGKGVLTISEEPGFARQGTAFNFVVINEKLKFEANLKAINSAGLKAGSQLLKLAIIVE